MKNHLQRYFDNALQLLHRLCAQMTNEKRKQIKSQTANTRCVAKMIAMKVCYKKKTVPFVQKANNKTTSVFSKMKCVLEK